MPISTQRCCIFICLVFVSLISAKAVSDNDEHVMESLPLHFRLAFMRGHVEAGLALYRANEFEMAAPHLLHPVSETHELERAGLEQLGLNSDLFVLVSEALEAKEPAANVEPLLLQAESNLHMLALRAGGDPAQIIDFLLDTIVEEYSIAFTDGVLTNIGEYQDAYGFRVVASDHAAHLPLAVRETVSDALVELGKLWINGPLPTNMPTPVGSIKLAVDDISKALAGPDLGH